MSATFSSWVYSLFSMPDSPAKIKYTIKNGMVPLPDFLGTSLKIGRHTAVRIKIAEMISLALTGSPLHIRPKSIGTTIAPPEPIIAVRVMEILEYEYIAKNKLNVERKPYKKEYISVTPVTFMTNLLAINRMIQATTALIRFA